MLATNRTDDAHADPHQDVVGKNLWIWSFSDKEATHNDQFFSKATVVSVKDGICEITADVHDEAAHSQRYTLEAVLRGLQDFENGLHRNPKPPAAPPYSFYVLAVDSDDNESLVQKGDTFVRVGGFSKTMWLKETRTGEPAYMWQEEEGSWCVGREPSQKVYFTAKQAAYPHEIHAWRVQRADGVKNVDICFSARLNKPGDSGGAARGGRAGGAAGGSSSFLRDAVEGASALASLAAGSSGASSAELKVGDELILSYGGDKEGWCTAVITTVGAVLVQYECDKDIHGQLYRQSKGQFSRDRAQRCKNAFSTKSRIYDPHPGHFSEFVITHAPKNAVLSGKYVWTSLIVNGKPVYKKEKSTSASVTHAWCSTAGTWIIGALVQLNANTNEGFAVAEHSTAWPHYTHDYAIGGDRCKIFSFCVKAPAPELVELFSDEDEGGENGEGGAGGEGDSDADEAASEAGGSAGSEARRGKRTRVPTERTRPDLDTQNSMMQASMNAAKRRARGGARPSSSGRGGGAGGAAGRSGGGADGAGGAAGAAGAAGATSHSIPHVR